ncbi:hypothetical protein CI109_103480 [Kwoniella shandongensis]|uniref:Ataxin-10 homolog n=1 Tax=Kwoniella shandongensis TaxID=1734106 RepID=A0A5M6BXM2_9TREE|nr:uncharacterized protein CI109_004617 [Kwoniella shandongensis]KAA5527081.1 hypothetical protein CI109_004617 [Kwoniella shandongensis]
MVIHSLASALSQGVDQVLRSDETCLEVASEAEKVARYLAHNLDEREELVDLEDDVTIFTSLSPFWTSLARSFEPNPTTSSSSRASASEDSRISLALALGKLERNLVAGLQLFQEEAVKHEAAIRGLIFNITTFVRIEDKRFFTLQSVLTQLLSNIISPSSPAPGADKLTDQYLRLYLSGQREDDVIIRLLDSRDVKTNHATLHLLNNAIRGSRSRLELLLLEPGVRWCAKILGRMDDWVENHDGLFELGASIFNTFISQSLHPRLFALLSTPSEPLTPNQTVLLKVLDSHISSTSTETSIPLLTSGPPTDAFLLPLFHTLSTYAQFSIAQGVDDPRLPKVFEGLILLSEGLSSMGLTLQARKDRGENIAKKSEEDEMVGLMTDGDSEKGLVKPIVELLKSLNTFFPRLNPRTQPSESSPPEHLRPFSNLKRNLVQLLGILCYDDISVGDQIREYGGVELVLSMTEIDESNPYLREHALFCVRNLMLNNPSNQAIIKQMDPVGVLSDTGEVLPLPEKMKRKPESG